MPQAHERRAASTRLLAVSLRRAAPRRPGAAQGDGRDTALRSWRRPRFRRPRQPIEARRRCHCRGAERQHLEPSDLAALDRPLEHGWLAAGDHDSNRRSERREELVAKPRIGDPEHLIGVDEDHARTGGRVRARAGGVCVQQGDARRSKRSDAAGRRRLDRSAVHLCDRHALVDALLVEAGQQRRLADPGDAIHEAHPRAPVVENTTECCELGVSADQQGGRHDRHGVMAFTPMRRRALS